MNTPHEKPHPSKPAKDGAPLNSRALESVGQPLGFVRAPFQPCRNRRKIKRLQPLRSCFRGNRAFFSLRSLRLCGNSRSRNLHVSRLNPMRATGPTARPAHAFFQLRLHPLHVLLPGFRFLHRDHPADPFIARQRRNVLPSRQRRRISDQRLPQIRRHFVHHAAGKFFAHRLILYAAELKM